MRKSAGLLLFRSKGNEIEVFLVHPGGPYWKSKDEGAWSIPKGEFSEDEDGLATAIREFKEETGSEIKGEFIELLPVRLKSGKMVYAWAIEGDIDEESIVSNVFNMEWPPKSGKYISVPEIDKGGWFPINVAREKINQAQKNLIEQLTAIVHKNTN